jgi:hypothetical protein
LSHHRAEEHGALFRDGDDPHRISDGHGHEQSRHAGRPPDLRLEHAETAQINVKRAADGEKQKHPENARAGTTFHVSLSKL